MHIVRDFRRLLIAVFAALLLLAVVPAVAFAEPGDPATTDPATPTTTEPTPPPTDPAPTTSDPATTPPPAPGDSTLQGTGDTTPPQSWTTTITAVDVDSGQPVAGVSFSLFYGGGGTGIRTAPQSVPLSYREGGYSARVEAWPAGYTPVTEVVNFANGDTNVVLPLRKVGSEPVKQAVTVSSTEVATDKPVPGVVFQIMAPQGVIAATGTTATTVSLAPGTYRVNLVQIPAGYSPVSSKNEFVVGDKPTAVVVHLQRNTVPLGSVTLVKTDAIVGKRLAGAHFSFTPCGDTKVAAAGVSDKDGVLKVWLPAGCYLLRETWAPVGYAQNGSVTKFAVTAGKTTTIKALDLPVNYVVYRNTAHRYPLSSIPSGPVSR